MVRAPAQPLAVSKGGMLTQRFPEIVSMTSPISAYLVFSLSCGDVEVSPLKLDTVHRGRLSAQISTLHKFADLSSLDTLLGDADTNDSDLMRLLETDLAFVLQPAGSALRHLPVKGPKDADPVAKAFGKEACSMRK